jgi:hypothetical protein
MSSQELWTLRRDAPRMSVRDADLTGFQVVGVDGVVGVVVSTSGESGRSHVVVDIGQWFFGRRVVIPGRFVRDVDHSSEALYVRLSREQVRAAPPYDPVAGHDGHRALAEAYFGPIAARPGPQAGGLVRGPSAGRRTTASSASRPAADRTAGAPRRQARR